MKILVIDDSDDDVYITEKIIRKNYPDVEITSFNMGQKALDYLMSAKKKKLPDIIFLDIRMPAMDGFEFLEKYEKLPANITQHSMLYLLTSSDNPDDIKRAEENKLVVSYITKPVQAQAFKKIFKP